ncbi:MAG: RecQ family ATP-dependent DNA helicase [Gemmatimonadetes bacterium]|nr:RecQ family ATP-dependent DNA helicase [Gemmatimonadota bacterium]
MDDLSAALHRHFGHSGFRPGQERLVRALLGGRDAVGLLPTGGGKSVTYLLPAAIRDDLTLVVSPLVSLMADQERRAREIGLPAAAVHGGMPAVARRNSLRAALEGRLRVLLVAPERLRSPGFAAVLESGRIGRIAVDEAHCVVQWGFDFRPAYLALAGIGVSVGCPVLAVTATATPSVRRTLEAVLGLRDPVRVQGSFDRPNLAWLARRVRNERARWLGVVAALERGGPTLIYAPTRRTVEAIRKAVARRGVGAEAYHAGLAPAERSRVQDRFLAGEVRVVVATNAFGMGVDKADVRQVVHWSPPGSLEAWYQESGRAGRDGAPARAIVFWRPADLRLQARLGRAPGRGRDGHDRPEDGPRRPDDGRARHWRRAARARLRHMARWLRTRRCRRARLLGYLGEPSPPPRCEGCDRCRPSASL